MVRLVDLTNEREAIKNNVDIVEAQIAGHAAVPLSEVMVNQLIQMTEDAKRSLQDVQKKIQLLNPAPADLADHVTEYKRLFTLTMNFHANLHGIKSRFPAAHAHVIPPNQDIRLPRLELPKFSGQIQDWLSFRDMFDTAVNSNATLSKVQKFTYLKSLVQGDAARQLQSMPISDVNYDIAWSNINDRYNNNRELLFAIIKRLVAHPSLQQQSSSSLRTLIDLSKECRRSLAVLNIPIDKGLEAFFLFHIFTKLDQTTRETWEQSLKDTDIPLLDDFLEFLEQRARALAAGLCVRTSSRPPVGKDEGRRNAQVHLTHSTTNCRLCQQSPHPIFKCSKFNSASVPERLDAVKKFNLCFNCLAGGHGTKKCTSSGRCRQCQSRHHTLLHKQEENSSAPETPPSASALALHNNSTQLPSTLLATAVVRVHSSFQNQFNCRALLDGGSTLSFITDDCCKKLRLQKSKVDVDITGLSSSSVGSARWSATITVQPHFQSPKQYTVTALVLPSITGSLPSSPFKSQGMQHLKGLTLADPAYHTPSRVDLLFGSDLFWDILLSGRKNGNPQQPSAFESTLGWLVAGKSSGTPRSFQSHVTNAELRDQLQQFWELEDLEHTRTLTSEEHECEDSFNSTHSRGPTGGFTVSIPWRNPRPTLGSTYDIALRRFHQLERRLPKNESHHKDYLSFMKEYEALGHMEEVPEEEQKNPSGPTSYIPHHFVLKMDSTTTKFRVVFDASCKSSNGVSLNDSMLVGPVLQDGITDIITRFRCHAYAFTADIQKMYRQIKLPSEDVDMHRILWRSSPSLPLKQYRLLTVTYGTASAPYLATKCLQKLAKDEESTLPLASKAALNDFYVDDLMSGAASLEEATLLQDQLLELTRRGSFPLRKWSSNSPALVERLPAELCEVRPISSLTSLEQPLPTSEGHPKTLGLIWDVNEDTFKYKVQSSDCPTPTMRSVLSCTAKLYDPLGWISPIVICPKIFMQDLWKLSLKWDDTLPTDKQEEWYEFQSTIKDIASISVRRCILPATPTHFIIAGFSDASEKAYSAVVYSCAYFSGRPPAINLLTSKTRVAPARQVSIPRLELCGAHLLSRLVASTVKSLKISVHSIHCYTDSTIVLSWISSLPSRWKTFVANRVSEVQTNLPSAVWSHVPGEDNPADCASRGVTPSELRHHHLWWNGPSFLRELLNSDPSSNSFSFDDRSTDEEKKVVLHSSTRPLPCPMMTMLNKYSSLVHLLRVTSWILRFKWNCSSNKSSRTIGTLSVTELKASLTMWIQIVQKKVFEAEIQAIQNGDQVHHSSPLVSLQPFIDEDGLLHVGGRLRKSALPYAQKHPILLPSKSHLTLLIIRNAHITNCHAGPQLIQAVLFQQYWILRGRDTIRNQIKRCVTCRRNAPILQQQQMADLPVARVLPARPFLRCGVDYAGPFILRPIPSRAKSTFKAYLALFVCLVTRAIHLEVVSSLSTECFIAALRRFTSRRGRPSDMYSDQGTNFVGADKELRKLLAQTTNYEEVANQLSKDGTQWHFNPPGAPHFGGLWEAGVKSVKFHLHRVIGNTTLNLEEMTTITTQIEGILNSRPLTAQSSDPSDLTVLTPAHFLIGSPLTTIPDPDLNDVKIGRLSRWQLLQKINQDFWRRWSGEFLTRLQQRPKWHQVRTNIQADDLVIIKDERLPPQRWKLGRVVELHPGADKLVRVVTVKTAEGVFKRPVTKLCLLPIHDSD